MGNATAATEYASGVVGGGIVAGPHVRAACKRHLADCGRDDIEWRQDEVDRVEEFFTQCLMLSSGKFEGLPFDLLPWQRFVLGSLFGWHTLEGSRRFRSAYIETGKGSGKSPLVAGIGLYSICADREPRAETYLLARTADQCMPTFRDAVSMVEQSPMLSERLRISGGTEHPWNISHHGSMSFFRRVTSERQGKGKSGPKPHFVLCDEFHEQDTSDMLDMYDAGKKNRRQPMTVVLTNAGIGKASPCGVEHDHAVAVAHGDQMDDRLFSYVCSMDSTDEPFKDEGCWPKANPSLPLIPSMENIRAQVAKGRAMPSKRSMVNRLHFCNWVDAESPWIDPDAWDRCEIDSLPDVTGAPCWAGIDLGLTTDFTAAALVWRLGKDELVSRIHIWTPGEMIEERAANDRAPYRLWSDEGDIVLTPGRVLRMGWVSRWLSRVAVEHDLMGVAFDRWKVDLLEDALDIDGVETTRDPKRPGLLMVPHSQGWVAGTTKTADKKRKTRRAIKADPPPLFMPRSIDAIEGAILSNEIRVEKNRALRAAALGAVTEEDQAGNRRLTKRKSTTRIDPIVALTMAVGYATARPDREKPRNSHYETASIRVL